MTISQYIRRGNKKYPQRLGWFGPRIGIILILIFAIIFFPLYIYMLFFNKFYFWIRRQKPISTSGYFNYDRHKLPHLSKIDKFWCEYCEWANGGLQWISAIVNEIERRYCPIQNYDHPHCEKAKGWRDEFLKWDHEPVELEIFYEKNIFIKNRNDVE